MFTLVLKDGRQVSSLKAEDLDTFLTKEESERENQKRRNANLAKRFPLTKAKKSV